MVKKQALGLLLYFFFSGFFRATFIIVQPYIPEYDDRNSKEFRQISEELSRAVTDLYSSVPGTQSATVIQIKP